jgi:Serine dehydratase beta chain
VLLRDRTGGRAATGDTSSRAPALHHDGCAATAAVPSNRVSILKRPPRKPAAARGQAMISVFELFKIGVGPSSSHTVGPTKASAAFANGLVAPGAIDRVATVEVRLMDSLAPDGDRSYPREAAELPYRMAARVG